MRYIVLYVCTDEKEKYDPSGFRDALVQGLERAGGDLDAAYKYLDAAGSKLDYRRYGEVIFDVLIAGGLLREYRTYRTFHLLPVARNKLPLPPPPLLETNLC